ncbi:MAG: DUF2809 domain-containing protein [Bacteroidales bacterium]
MKRLMLIPPMISDVMSRNSARIYKLTLMLLVLITALYTKEYHGQFEVIIHNKVGGVFYVLFFSLLFSVMFRRWKPWWPVVMALGVTSVLEFIQYFRFPMMVELTRSKVFAYLFGNSFSWGDFTYYFAGGAVALLLLVLLEVRAKQG